jgi:hypothetical protein
VRFDGPPGGDVKVVSAQDLGSCAPSAWPGERYRVRLELAADVAVRLMAFTRDRSGRWSYLAESAPFEPPPSGTSAGVVPRSWVTPPMPVGAVAVSVGVQAEGSGQVAVAAAELRRDA